MAMMALEDSQVPASQKDSKVVKLHTEVDLKDVKCPTEQQGASDIRPTKDIKGDRDSRNTKPILESEICSSVPVHVLAVDDNFVDRKIIERLVKGASFNVIAVDSGAKALEVLASVNSKINLIITDYCMPEMSGYDLLRHVKESPVLKDIPVVIVSSEKVPSRIERCLEEGAEEFMLKPVRLADIKRLEAYVSLPKENSIEPLSVSCKKRKYGSDGFQVQSPDRGPRVGSVTVA